MYIKNIRKYLEEGAPNFEEVQEKTNCSTGYTLCKLKDIPVIEELLKNK